jgi:AraC family transcriptional regulator of adaptative response/methylated-DNA-[protein]-cysteine methyltransferase
MTHQKKNMLFAQHCIDTPCGPLVALADQRFLYFVGFLTRSSIEQDMRNMVKKLDRMFSGGVVGDTVRATVTALESNMTEGRSEPVESLQKELEQYFAGSLEQFKTPLHFFGSPFQQAVWHALRDIPYGQTVSYADLAKKIGKPTAFRAVAQANAANPFSILIPCHRVVQKDGGIGGYNGGLACKRWLLEHEKRKNSTDHRHTISLARRQ